MFLVILRGRVPKSFWEGLGRPRGGSRGGCRGRFGSLLGPSWAPLGLSWLPFGPSCAPSGLSWAPLGPSWALLGLSWSLLGRFWVVMTPQEASKTPQDASGTPPGHPHFEIIFTFLHMFIHSQGFRPEMGFKMWSKNGVQSGVQQWGPNMGSNMGSTMGSKHGVQIGGPDLGGLPQMVAPRQFCFDTFGGRVPKKQPGALRRPFVSIFQNGVHNGVQ